MKIATTGTKYTQRKVVFGIIISVLILIGGIVFYLEKTRTTDFIKDPFYKESNLDIEQATENDSTTKNKANLNPMSGVDTNKTADQIPESTTARIEITSLSQSNSTITAVISITNPAHEGLCTYIFTKEGGKPVTRSINTTTANCSVSIPELEFGMLGNWKLEAKYFADNTQATTNSEVSIQ